MSTEGEVTKDPAIEKPEAFAIVNYWQHVELVLFEIPSNKDVATWFCVRCDDKCESVGEAVQFVSLKPDLIRSRQSVH